MPKQQQRQNVVGFYKDHGQTKPITKSTAELNRTKVVQQPQRFRGVSPQNDKQLRERQRAQLDNTIGKMKNIMNVVNTSLERRGHDMEDMKKLYDIAAQDNPAQAKNIQMKMNRMLFTVQSLARKRDDLQKKISDLESMRSRL